ncbi:hypothetical protein PCANC_25144 [Puccinia coronata f. sp. avenae]|uniref:Mannan endo-1,6-alpha-mannosidase n=1 Tax=Puccinia coronata f. sp. avenae TaxID=200324 RepID=A0A2N5UQ44_9BASI|nr:hypothetical protein PCANC_25144 [Puccinia coronata f. sp. avenae]PLW39883.1 hypothetical protein PCASD_07880 [Puccinia coronata f. sp. avenae]
MYPLKRLIHSGLLSLSFVQAAPKPAPLDINNLEALKAAASMAMKNLMSYYKPNSEGTFSETQTPWHESGMIWDMHFDYARWSGDTQFLPTVTQALFHQSRGDAHNFLGPNDQTEGQWNDDILWPSQVSAAAAEFFGAASTIPGGNSKWIELAERTFHQASTKDQLDAKCGGGIYWYRDRKSAKKGPYKSLITQLEFISQGARNYLINRDRDTLKLSQQILSWVMSSGLGNARTGILLDGVSVTDCGKFRKQQWSYNYGQLLGSLAWLNRATGNTAYLDFGLPFFDVSRRVFAPSNIITEPCEATRSCNRDQQGFKAIYARNLVYYYQQTNNQRVKTQIRDMISTSVAAMVSRSCDANYNCGGNWTLDTQPVHYVRSQHVSTALLVAAIGIHSSCAPKQTGPALPSFTLKSAKAYPY